MQKNSYIAKQGHTGLLVMLAAMTIVLILGIKYFVGDDSASAPQQSAARTQPLFDDTSAGKPAAPVYNPAARSETGSGGGLEMFSKTNAGYYGEETSSDSAAAPKTAEPEVKKSTAAAAPGKPAVKAAKTTVIPRLQGSKAFGAAGPSDVSPHSAGQGMPDISAIMQQAQSQTRKKQAGQ